MRKPLLITLAVLLAVTTAAVAGGYHQHDQHR